MVTIRVELLFTAIFFRAATTVRAVVESRPVNQKDSRKKEIKGIFVEIIIP